MRIRELSGKNICILGFGKEGQATLKALEEYAPGCEVTVADQNEHVALPDRSKHWLQVGTGWLHNLDRFDVLIKSPGIPPSSKLKAQSSKLTTPTQIFFDSIQDSGATVIGVTGSKGKSTTSSLIHHILQANCQLPIANSHLIGNIGDPAIAHLKEANLNTIFVHELSSYQLMDLTVSPAVAVVTSFFPEHLDYHGSLETYKEAKRHIARFQKKDDVIFFAKDSAGAREIAQESHGKHIPFSTGDAPLQIEETKLIGTHNLSNIAAAFLVSQHLSVPKDTAIEAIKTFTPLPHRLQSLGVRNGLEWVDDSISTTPDSAIAALDALGDRVKTMLLGGQDRGLDFSPLAKRLQSSSVRTAILFPGSGKRIRTAIAQSAAGIHCFEVTSMEEAVTIAKQCTHSSQLTAHSSPIILLSPASPSYGMFKNFEERGDRFRQCIEKR
ncbi:MAG: UDP-N-acetylmuramoyl-L-alanine--D-glutamate ligase [Candidatus Peregrinibacteria bacterium]